MSILKARFVQLILAPILFSYLVKAQNLEIPKPQIFMEGKVSTKYSERDMAISPNGQQAYFTFQTYQFERQIIMEMNRTEQGWSTPKVASFSGQHKDLEASFSPDGKRLYFSSNRPTRPGEQKTDFDLWYMERDGATNWSEPVHMSNVINTSENEFYPSVVNDGSIYYTSSYKDTKGYEDIYYSKWNGNEFLKPVSLDSTVNTKVYEFNAYVAPDESYMFFSSYGRSDGEGAGDIYISFQDKNDKWLPAVNLGGAINSKGLDYCPSVSPDGQYLYFTSNRSDYDRLTEKLNRANLQKAMNGVYNGFDNVYRVPVNLILRRSE